MNNIRPVLLLILGLAGCTASAQTETAIRQIDFDNFSYVWSDPKPPEDVNLPWHWLSSTPDQHFRALHGIHHFYLSNRDNYVREHSPIISVESITYGDLDGDRIEEAVVALNYSTGGTQNWDYLYVYLRVSPSRYQGNQHRKSFRFCKRKIALPDGFPTRTLSNSFRRPRQRIHSRRSCSRGHCPA
jgi:hypothetical protein